MDVQFLYKDTPPEDNRHKMRKTGMLKSHRTIKLIIQLSHYLSRYNDSDRAIISDWKNRPVEREAADIHCLSDQRYIRPVDWHAHED